MSATSTSRTNAANRSPPKFFLKTLSEHGVDYFFVCSRHGLSGYR